MSSGKLGKTNAAALFSLLNNKTRLILIKIKCIMQVEILNLSCIFTALINWANKEGEYLSQENIFIEGLLFILRVLQPFWAIFIIYQCFVGLRKRRRPEQPLVNLINMANRDVIPVLYWENSIGRSKNSDIILTDETVSRNHAVLYRRDEGWIIEDTTSKSGTRVNNKQITEPTCIHIGDCITCGLTSFVLDKVKTKNKTNKTTYISDKKVSQLKINSAVLLLMVTISHFIAAIQLCFSDDSFNVEPLVPFIFFTAAGWVFYAFTHLFLHKPSFELETLAFFLSGIGISIIASDSINNTYMQIIAMMIGMCFYTFLQWFLEDPDTVMKWRLIIAIGAIGLLALNLIIGSTIHGSKNWIVIGPISIQPSEFVKIALVMVGTSTLVRLQTAKNLTEFIGFSSICIGALFLMSDFGTACIFFLTFLIISFMRSGDIRTIVFILAAAILGTFLILQFKPYIAERFSAWGHAFDFADSTGYQQAHVLTYSASGGLFGVGLGQGNLKYIFASTSDLVFGMICEELGLIMAILVAVSIAGIAFYARALSSTSRSTLYSISACAVGGMFVFQSMLNIFGATDILPLTGVTLPFISLGGSSMISVWGLLAFIKSAAPHDI